MKKGIVFGLVGLFVAASAHAETLSAPVSATARAGVEASVAAPIFMQTLMMGSRGADVKALQEVLVKEGFLSEDNSTGFYGMLTQDAVKKWQEKRKLPPVGVVGPITRAVLNKEIEDVLVRGMVGIPLTATIGHVGVGHGTRSIGVGTATRSVRLGGESGNVMEAHMEGIIPAKLVANESARALLVSPVFNDDLTVGAKGEAVLKLQKFLIANKLLTDDSMTGFFGERTREAVKKWQEAHNLPAAGFVGPMTRELLKKEVEAKTDVEVNETSSRDSNESDN